MGTHSGPEGDEAAMATSFGTNTEAYEAGRPSYPDEAVSWMLDGVAVDAVVADVGAGTGKLTRSIADAGHRVIAVDPDADMLHALSAGLPGVAIYTGSAETLPFDDASIDVVTMGQAWHWVKPERASAEIGRVVRPGGRLALVWNIRDEKVPWVRALSEIVNRSAAERLLIEVDDVGVEAPFEALERMSMTWARPMTRPMIEQMVASRSYYLTATDSLRADIDHGLAELLDSRPELAGGGPIDMPYVTHAFRSRRPDD